MTIFLFLLDATVRSGIEGTGPYFLSEVECTGSEDNLTACPSDSVGRHVCSRQDSAGVTCTSLIQDSDTDAGIIAGAVTGAGVTCTSLIQDSYRRWYYCRSSDRCSGLLHSGGYCWCGALSLL